MKLSSLHTRRAPSRLAAFSIAETVLWLAVALLVGAGLISTQFFGQRMWDITQTKVNVSDNARQIVRLLSSDVRSAKLVRVGSGAFNSFTEAASGATQSGNALQVHPTADTNLFVRYYRDPSDQCLKYCTNNASVPVVIARSVSNSVVFTLEDFAGNVLKTRQQKSIVGLELSFSALSNPDALIGPGRYYKSYHLRTKLAQQTQ